MAVEAAKINLTDDTTSGQPWPTGADRTADGRVKQRLGTARPPCVPNERPQLLGMLASAPIQRRQGGCQSDVRRAQMRLGLHSLRRRNVWIINLVREVVHD
jgi:hypothetical protein